MSEKKNNQELDKQVLVSEILERITDAFVALDKNWRYTYMNKKAGEIFNRDPLSMIGKHIWTEFPEGVGQPFHKAYEKAMKDQQYVYLEEYYAPYDLWFENHIYPSPAGLSIFFRDISQKKKTEQELQKSKSFIQSIINSSPDIIYIYDIDEGKNVFVNEGMQKNLDYTDEDIKEMGKQLLPKLMHPDDFQFYLQHTYPRYATAADRELITHEFRMRHKTGRWHWLFTKELIFLRNPNGTPKQIFGITTDITEPRETELKLKRETRRRNLLLDYANDGIFVLDQDLRVVESNKTFERMLGRTHEETIGAFPWSWDAISYTKEIFNQTWPDAILTPEKFETQIRRADGSIFDAEINGSPGITESEDQKFVLFICRDITERKKAEEEIRERTTQLKTLSDNLPGTMMYQVVRQLNGSMRFTYISKSVEQLAGKSPEQIIQDPSILYNLIIEEDRKKVTEAEEISYKTMSPFNAEVRSRNLDGEIRWWYIRSVPRKLTDGRVIWDGIHTDITERKIAEEKVKLSEQSLNDAQQIAKLGSWEFDLSAQKLRWSKEMYRIFECEENPEDSKDEEWRKKIHPDDRDKVLESNETIRIAVEKGVEFNYEHRIIANDGSIKHIAGKGTPVKNSKGEVVLIKGITEDITESKKIEEQLRLSKERFMIIFEKAPYAASLSKAQDGKIEEINEAFENLFGYSKAETIGKNTMELNFYKNIEDREKMMARFRKEGSIRNADLMLRTKQGEMRDVIISSDLVDIGAEKYILTVAQDISEKKRAEQEMLREKEISDTLINSLPGIFYFYNKKGKFIRWNKNFSIVSGYTDQEISDMHPLDFFDDDEKPLLKRKIDNVFTSGEDTVEAGFLLKSGKKIPFYFTGKVIDYNSEQCLMGVGINVSDRMAAMNEAKKTSEQLRQLAAHLQNIREEERKRISREIHDELGQQLTAVKMDVAWIDKKIAAEDIAIKEKIKNTITLLDGSNLSIRKILNELRSGIMDERGLIEALVWQGEQFTKNTSIPVKFNCSESEIIIDEPKANCIFRIYQEALTNIARYAEAKKVIASLSRNENEISLEIGDDGKGFAVDQLKNKRSFGILGMKERVASLNGSFKLASSPGNGTTISISIPLKQTN